MTFVPRPQEIYRHFKGNLYQIVTIAEHSETGEKLVIYQAMYGDFKTYARELSMFTSRVDRVKYPQVTQEFRFELMGPNAERQRRECGAAPAPTVFQSTPAPAVSTSATLTASTPVQAAPTPAMFQGTQTTAAPTAASVNAPAPAPVAPAPAPTTGTSAPEQPDLDPLIVEFLDADTYEERLNILAAVHHRVTQDMITTMAVACDVEVGEGEVEERYSQLKKCLLTMEKFECNRMR
ncbi:MAG: DUF1653 domain-containing protein [Lachnospiraceae bacterium]|nr:DUF1653 domain-containing protein [Lachnospiraceae bacterium]